RRPQLSSRTTPGHGAAGRNDHDQGRGADGRDAHVRPGSDLDDRRPRRLPHAVPALRRGAEPRRPEADRRDEEGAGRGKGLAPPHWAEAGRAHLRGGRAVLRRLRLGLLQPFDEVGDVCELLLEVALVLLEALEDALWL